jgi:hypothetical protein
LLPRVPNLLSRARTGFGDLSCNTNNRDAFPVYQYFIFVFTVFKGVCVAQENEMVVWWNDSDYA